MNVDYHTIFYFVLGSVVPCSNRLREAVSVQQHGKSKVLDSPGERSEAHSSESARFERPQ